MLFRSAIAKYTPIFSVLVGVIVLEAVLGVPGINKRVKKAVIKQMPLRLHISLQVKVLRKEEVFKKEIVRV